MAAWNSSRNCVTKIVIILSAYLATCSDTVASDNTASEDSNDAFSKPGHLQILGKHRPPEGHIEIIHALPTPKEFWEKYVKNGIPVLFRGMAKNSVGQHAWTDDYLLQNYADLRVKIEAKAEKDYYPEGDMGIGQDTLQYFLKTYRTRNAYVVSQLPDPMSKEVSVPPFLTCGTFGQRLLEANLWLSSGGTKSLLHRDADNAINCLYNGTKDWIFIEPKYEDKIPIAEEEVKGYGGFSMLNPDSVDLQKFPSFAEVPWWYGNVTAGDCIFLPCGHWHQVRSYGPKNLAVSLLFSRLSEVKLDDCEDAELSYKPLSEMDMVFTYDGFSEQTMGDTDPFELNETIKEWCHHSASGLDRDAVFHSLVQEYRSEEDGEISPNSISDADVLIDIADQVMQVLDKDKSGVATCNEVSSLSLSTLKKLANIMDRDPANTEEYEYAKFEPQDVREFILGFLQHHETRGHLSLKRHDFVGAYQQFGGSKKIGHEVFSELDPDGRGTVTITQARENVDDVANLFSKKMRGDRVDPRWEKEQMEWKTNVIHNEL